MFKSLTGGIASLGNTTARRSAGDPNVPSSIRKAVRTMYAGAVATGVLGLFLIIVTIANKNALTDNSGKKLSNSQFTGGIVGSILIYAIFVALWVLVARWNQAGHNWARITGTVLFALWTWDSFTTINSLRGGMTVTFTLILFLVLTLLIWVIAVAAVGFLWRPDASRFFKEQPKRL